MKPKQAIETLHRRKKNQFVVDESCFKEQIDFIDDETSFATACCSRRAGKTVACAVDLTREAIRKPGRVNVYITLSRSNAKKIIWPELIDLNRRYNLGGIPNETELSMRYPGNSFVYCSGAKDKTQIENFRGQALNKVYIDESQAFRNYLQEMIDDVLSKTLYDYDGKLRLIGTPGPVPAGYFYECCHSKEWNHHAWTMFQNPYLEKKSGKSPYIIMQKELERRGITVDHPSIQRECFGRWVVDPNSLVFRYDKSLNDFKEVPSIDVSWEYVIGVDIGFEDADAIAVIGWNPKIKESYLVEEIVQTKQGITELANSLEKLIAKYNPLRVVMDTGGLGKKIAEEIQRRYSLPITAAEKTRKFEFIELLNDALRTKRFFAKSIGRFAQDSQLVEWDKDSEKLKISDSYHSDITDAVLYGFRESLHWTFMPEPIQPKENSEEWFKKQTEMMENELIKQLNDKKDEDIWGDSGNNDWEW